MNINTGKLASNSSSLLKKIKENDSNNKVSKSEKIKNINISKTILKNLSEIEINNKSFKSRIINLNKIISNYENELSESQFIENKLEQIENLLQNKNNSEINVIINNSLYNNKKILKNYFKNNSNIKSQLETATKIIKEKFNNLEVEYKTIKITTQNIISLYSYSENTPEENIKKVNSNNLINTTILNNKRVLDLIS